MQAEKIIVPRARDASSLGARQKLLKFFEWRGATAPEDHADEVLNRLARKIEHGEALRDLSSYSVGVARMMLLEISRELVSEISY